MLENLKCLFKITAVSQLLPFHICLFKISHPLQSGQMSPVLKHPTLHQTSVISPLTKSPKPMVCLIEINLYLFLAHIVSYLMKVTKITALTILKSSYGLCKGCPTSPILQLSLLPEVTSAGLESDSCDPSLKHYVMCCFL